MGPENLTWILEEGHWESGHILVPRGNKYGPLYELRTPRWKVFKNEDKTFTIFRYYIKEGRYTSYREHIGSLDRAQGICDYVSSVEKYRVTQKYALMH